MKKKTQKIIAIGLATALVGSSVIAPCARAFATPSVIYTQGSTCPRVNDSRLVQFEDPNFKTAVLRSLKAQGIIDESATEVTKEQALKVTNFYSSGKELSNSYIFDISGIEEFKNLEQLYLDNNNITNINPLKNLTKLYNLWLGKNNISDISALSNLHELVTLSLYGNHIIDIQPLLGLKKITALSLYNQTLTQSIYEKTSKLNIKYIDDLDFTVSPELGSVTNGNFTFNNLPKTRSGIIRFQSKSATVAGVTTSRNGGGIGYEGFIKLDFSSFGLPASESQTQDTSQSLLAYLTDAATIRKTTNYRNAAYEKLAQDKQTSDNQNLAQIAELTNTLGVLRNQVHSLEDEKSSLESQIAALQQQLQDLSKQADTCSVNDEANVQEIKSLKAQLAEARAKLEKLTQDKNTSDTDKQKALDELRAKLNELQPRNNHVLPSSTSSRNASKANSKKSKSAPTVKDSSKATSGNLAKTSDVFSVPAFLSLCSTGLISATLGIKFLRKKKDV